MCRSDNAWQTRFHGRSSGERDSRIARLLDAADAGVDRARDLAGKLTGCGRYPVVWQKPSGRLVVSSARCKSRICPTCAPLRVVALEARVRAAVSKIDDARLITLTLASSDAPLSEQLARLRECFTRLRRRRVWSAHVRGGVATIEVTWSPSRQQWHPHLHIIADGTFWEQAKVADVWEAVTGDSRVVDIRRVPSREALVRYVAKYASKSQDPSGLPASRWIEWCTSTHGLRMASTFGSLHGTLVDHDDADEQGPCEHVASMAALAEATVAGDVRARRLIRSVQLRIRRGVPNDPGPAAERALRGHRKTARRLRTWSEKWKAGENRDDSPRSRGRPRKRGCCDRSQWLWQEPAPPADALSGGL